MNFNRMWFIVGYLLLLLFFGGLAVYSFTQFSQGIRALPDDFGTSVQVRDPVQPAQDVNGAEVESLSLTERAPMTLLFAGDVMLSRYVDTLIQRAGTPDMPWELMADSTQHADIFFVNLEAPFSDVGPYDDENMVFHVRPDYVSGLNFAGVDVVSFANNHWRDAGDSGVKKTKETLADNDIAYALPGEPTLMERRGWRIGFTAGAYTIGLNQDTLKADVASLQDQGADFIVSSMHAGVEYQKTPSTSQETYAHAAIDAGADLVVGHHPHVTQTIEEYNGGYIVYSLGNFIFDQFWSADTLRGQVLDVFLSEDNSTYALRDITINNKTQPSLVEIR
ncbi:MAG: CapA family protein [Patescibacteria group bacterium]|jgi:poly-gamma-glutamate synthesis protein (capsule biosynthesis protein)